MLRPIDEANERLHVGGCVDPSSLSIGASQPSTMMSAGRCPCLYARNLLPLAVPESTRAVAGSQTCLAIVWTSTSTPPSTVRSGVSSQ
jgi:hypothetical protein